MLTIRSEFKLRIKVCVSQNNDYYKPADNVASTCARANVNFFLQHISSSIFNWNEADGREEELLDIFWRGWIPVSIAFSLAKICLAAVII